jgi:hypothetical protein
LESRKACYAKYAGYCTADLAYIKNLEIIML